MTRSGTSRRSTRLVRLTVSTPGMVALLGYTRPSASGFKNVHPLPPGSRTGLTGEIQKNENLSHTQQMSYWLGNWTHNTLQCFAILLFQHPN